MDQHPYRRAVGRPRRTPPFRNPLVPNIRVPPPPLAPPPATPMTTSVIFSILRAEITALRSGIQQLTDHIDSMVRVMTSMESIQSHQDQAIRLQGRSLDSFANVINTQSGGIAINQTRIADIELILTELSGVQFPLDLSTPMAPPPSPTSASRENTDGEN